MRRSRRWSGSPEDGAEPGTRLSPYLTGLDELRRLSAKFSPERVSGAIGIAPEVVSRIRRRFVEHGVEGLADQPKTGRKDHAVKPEVVECIVQMALSPPPAGRTRWTTRLIGDEVDLTSATVAKVLRANGLKPHLVRTYKSAATPNSQRKSPTLSACI